MYCRALTDAREFEDLVQRNMEANCSFNYISMAHFMSTIALRQIARLSNRNANWQSDGFALERCLLILRQLLEVICSAYEQSPPKASALNDAVLHVLQERVDQILLSETSKNDLTEIIFTVIRAGECSY